MAPIRSFLLALAAVAVTTPAALAQENDAVLADMVEAWVEEQVPDYPEVVKAYGAECLTPVVLSMVGDAQQTLVDAGGMEAGLAELEVNDPDTLLEYLPPLQECIQTVIVGGDIIAPWVDAEWGDAPDEEKDEATACFMAAVQPLSDEAKNIIYLGEDFEAGAETLLEESPDMAEGLEDALEACD